MVTESRRACICRQLADAHFDVLSDHSLEGTGGMHARLVLWTQYAHLKLPMRFMHSWLPLSMMTAPPCSLACLASSWRRSSVPAMRASSQYKPGA